MFIQTPAHLPSWKMKAVAKSTGLSETLTFHKEDHSITHMNRPNGTSVIYFTI